MVPVCPRDRPAENVYVYWFFSCPNQVLFFDQILGILWGLVYGEGGAPGTIPLHNLRVTSHVLTEMRPSGGTGYVSFALFLGILKEPVRGEGAPLVQYLCKTGKSLDGRRV